jgi:GAF domain-containing protein
MYELKNLELLSKNELYRQLSNELDLLLGDETDFIANAANFSSLLYHSLASINWAGFYIHKEGQLVLGPFQGKPACIRIKIGNGVCGYAAANFKTILVEDVLNFSGHITCDSASRSEIVIPVIDNGELIGVLDLDSPKINRFDEQDQKGLEKLVEVFCEKTYFPRQKVRCA